MKILQLLPFPHRRGSEIFAAELNEWLEQAGHQVYTLFLYHYLLGDALRMSTPYTSALANYRSKLEKIPGINPRLLWFFKHTVDLFRPDIVQVNGGRALKYGALVKKLCKSDFKLAYRSIGSPLFWEKKRLGRLITQLATKSADGVVAVSDATLAEFEKAPPHQIRRRIHRGTNLEALTGATPVDRESLETPAHAQVLIYAGSLSSEKQPLRAVEILHQLTKKGEDAYLWMLGDGPQSEECYQLAKDRGVSDRLRLTGTVQKVAPYLQAADLHLLTSDTEGLPGCLVESAALGIPCVAADVGGVREIALDGETGFVVPANDISLYVKRARQILENPPLYAQFSERAKEWAKNFSIDTIGPQYLELYQELLATER